jgi:dihydroorotase
MTLFRIRNGRVIDPSQHLDQVSDLWLRDDRILGIGPQHGTKPDHTLDASGLIVCPGWIDMHVHLREPGREEDETIATGTAAALAGGVTSLACMANTEPALDNPAAITFVLAQARRARNSHVFPVGAVTRGRQNQELVDFDRMVEAGVVAFSDDGAPVANSALLRSALEQSARLGKVILDHAEDPDLAREAAMNEGDMSRRLGVRGVPSVAEDLMVFRDISLAELTGGRIHIQHVSTAGSVELIRRAQGRSVLVSGEACPHHFTLTDCCLATRDTNFKMSPPLRNQADVEAVLVGLRDGTLAVIATDHAPHSPAKKKLPLEQAPNGIIGLETFLPICNVALIEPGVLTWPQLIEKVTINPARLLGIERGTLQAGAVADVTVIDPAEEWVIDPREFRSKSRNCPFGGWRVRGRVHTVFVGGQVKESWSASVGRQQNGDFYED